ncbi:MAG: hypothetical protein GWP61_20625 [Chloroflexi bacterium]|jgi:hypothetical protein|nr:hypothetical protein [Chloroflexota bacterium]
MRIVIFVVLIMVFMLAFATTAFAQPTNPPPNPHFGSCNMDNAWWDATGAVFEPDGPDYGPGNPNPKVLNERGMYNVHLGTNPHHGQHGDDPTLWYPNGATNMDIVTTAQCGG